METILATAFGRKVNVQRGENDQIIEAAQGLFESSTEDSGLSFLVLMPIFCELSINTGCIRREGGGDKRGNSYTAQQKTLDQN